MWLTRHFVVTLFAGSAVASPLLAWDTQTNTSLSVRDVSVSQQTVPIKRMAALGESYSAGIGAGDRLGSPWLGLLNDGKYWGCSRYASAYPKLVHEDARLGDPTHREFQFESCSGALIKDITETQIPRLHADQDVILLSAGGNDLELVNILNQCVYQFFVFGDTQALVGKITQKMKDVPAFSSLASWFADIDFDIFGRGCERQLAHSEGLLDGPEFVDGLLRVILAAKQKLSPGGMLYYTGYAKFFAESMSQECDKVSWETWGLLRYLVNSNWVEKAYLTVSRRQHMNRLVDKANTKIREAISRASGQVKYVDYDSYVGSMGGRFCEAGVDEASKESNARPGLMFYELANWDLLGKTNHKRGEADAAPKGTFKAQIDLYAQLARLLDQDATLNADKLTSVSTSLRTVTAEANVTITTGMGDMIAKVLPDGYGRVFHPTKLLHRAIAQMLVSLILGKPEPRREPVPDWVTGGTSAASLACQLNSALPPPPSNVIGDGAHKGGPGGQTAALGSSGPTNKGGLDSFIGSGTPKDISKATGQQVALASYINPSTSLDLWNRMIVYPADKVSVLVANVLNGPDSKVNPAWAKVINAAHGQGKTIIGYVRTGYLGVSKQNFQTMLGSTDLADWIAQIEADVETWYRLYPGKIMGIFFDEGWNECGPNNMYAEVYRMISDNTKRRHPGAFTVLNPGWFMPQCFEESADTLMTFESSYARYIDRTGQTYKENGWIPKDHRKIWHIIYKTPQDKISEVVALAKERHAGLLHITDAVMPNPYNTLPSPEYMDALLKAVDVGGPLVEPPHQPRIAAGSMPAAINNLRVVQADYTSVKLSWDIVGDADYVAIYSGASEVARLPASLRQVTVGGLEPGTRKHEFTARTVGSDGTEFALSGKVIADTLPLPGGKPIVNAKVAATGTETTFEADVYLPFAFVRIMITDTVSDGNFAYAINTDRKAVYAKYMIEGCTLYKYNGKALVKDAWPWQWLPTLDLDDEGCNMKVERNVYHYTWRVPMGTSTFDMTNFVAMGEGVSARTDVFMPCPCTWNTPNGLIGKEKDANIKYCDGKPKFCPYDCKGHTLCLTSSVKWCDEAVNRMQRGNHIYRSNGLVSESGNCWANRAGYGCSVLIRGKDESGRNCEISGDDLWKAYQDIRRPALGDCANCGTKHLGNGCMVTVDYKEGCDNRDSAINRYVANFAELGAGQTLGDGVVFGSMTDLQSK